jgi:hypothetical protein
MAVIKLYDEGSEEWLPVVVGRQGPQGIQGVQGVVGPPGADGDGTSYYGQISRQTTGSVTVTTQDVYYAIDLAGDFDSANSFGLIEGTDEDLALRNDTGQTQLFTVIGSADLRSANSQVLGLRLAVNGTSVPATECRATTGTTNYAKVLSQWIVELDPDDEVSLHVANHTGTTDITVDRAKVVAFTAGRQGTQGDPGLGLPSGGSTGQVLVKSTESDYETEWATVIGLQARDTAVYTTASIANLASESGTVTLATGYRLYRVSTDVPARVRLYTDNTKRDADVSRAIGTDPAGDHGVILDFVTTSTVLAADLSPLVDGFVASGADAGITVQNRSGSTGTVEVTFTYVRSE